MLLKKFYFNLKQTIIECNQRLIYTDNDNFYFILYFDSQNIPIYVITVGYKPLVNTVKLKWKTVFLSQIPSSQGFPKIR